MSSAKETVVHLETDADFKEFIKEGKVVVDFFTTWCKPCQFIAPIFAEMSTQYPNIKFAKVNVENVPDSGVSKVPTFKFYGNGKELSYKVTGMNPENLKLFVEKFNSDDLSAES